VLFIPEAFIIFEKKIYVPIIPENCPRAHSPVTALIEGICAAKPEQARLILRERICTKTPLTSREDGMVRVAAKRASILDEDGFSDRFLAAEADGEIIEVSPAATPEFKAVVPEKFSNLEDAMTFAVELKNRAKANPEPALSDRHVGAVLLGKHLEVLAYAWNTNGTIRTQHAELNLIRAFLENEAKCGRLNAKIPADSTLIVTLKPCAMCAAQIVAASDSISTLKIIYLEDDPGPKSKNSVLVKDSELWKKYGEPKVQLIHFQQMNS
jgi:tRNA(Arg) A34 adenosine deaminase TadA